MSTNRWKIELSNESNVRLEDTKFIFSQAEKRLEDTIKTGETIAAKTITILTLMTAIIVGIGAFVINKWTNFKTIDNKVIVSAFGIIYITLVVVYMIRNVLPNHYHVLGSMPKDLFSDIYFNDRVDRAKQTIYMYMSEIENYQFRIEQNWSVNDKRWAKYIDSVIALLIMPYVLAILFVILEATR
ncbi:MAG TPA: hypothetical protein VD993_16935 [Chitinophagaceae bacterium]|nr:hypothetical protein [Chitinophagaceae bacterium]